MARRTYVERFGIEVNRDACKDNVRALRKHLELNDIKFAELLGLTSGAVRMWESGGAVPTEERISEIIRVAREGGVEVSLEFLLTGIGPEPEWRRHVDLRRQRHPQRGGVVAPMAGTIPVRASLDNGDGSITISGELERARAPRNLVGREGAYGLFVPNDDMAPALRYGDIAWVDTLLPPGRDMEVVVEMPEGVATIGTLLMYGKDKITVEVLQPERRRIELSRDVAKAHRIVGKEARR